MFELQEMNSKPLRNFVLLLATGILLGCGEEKKIVAGIDYCVPAKLLAESVVPWWVPSDLPTDEAIRVKLDASMMTNLAGYKPLVGAWGQTIQPHVQIDHWSRWMAWEAPAPDSRYGKLLSSASPPFQEIPGTSFTAVFTGPDLSHWIVVAALRDGPSGIEALKRARLVAVCSRPTAPAGKEISADSASCFRILRDGSVALAYDFAATNLSISTEMDERVQRFAAQLRCVKP